MKGWPGTVIPETWAVAVTLYWEELEGLGSRVGEASVQA